MGTGTLKLGGSGRALVAVCVALGFAAAFAGPSCSSSDISADRPDGGPICQHGGTTCTSGTYCENGNCVATCANNVPCPSGQYCLGDAGTDAVCAPNQPLLCTSLFDCPPPQDCLSTMCTTAEPLGDGGLALCNPDGSTVDGCGPDAICLVLQSSNGGTTVQCRGMPACATNAGCPVGQFGSTCNQRPDGGRLLTSKQRICLLGYCTGPIDCASGQRCVLDPVPGATFGGCYSGFPGSPCNTPADCLNPDAGCLNKDAGVFGCCGPC
jgi:hypothetical protein